MTEASLPPSNPGTTHWCPQKPPDFISTTIAEYDGPRISNAATILLVRKTASPDFAHDLARSEILQLYKRTKDADGGCYTHEPEEIKIVVFGEHVIDFVMEKLDPNEDRYKYSNPGNWDTLSTHIREEFSTWEHIQIVNYEIGDAYFEELNLGTIYSPGPNMHLCELDRAMGDMLNSDPETKEIKALYVVLILDEMPEPEEIALMKKKFGMSCTSENGLDPDFWDLKSAVVTTRDEAGFVDDMPVIAKEMKRRRYEDSEHSDCDYCQTVLGRDVKPSQ